MEVSEYINVLAQEWELALEDAHGNRERAEAFLVDRMRARGEVDGFVVVGTGWSEEHGISISVRDTRPA